MPSPSLKLWHIPPAALAAVLIAAIGIAAILGAYFFQFVLKLQPCPLCLEQRIPYYVGIPIAIMATVAAMRGAAATVVTIGLLIIAALMLWGAGMGIYHAGVEWKWWPGPQDCAGPVNRIGTDLLKQLQSISVVRCDEAAWRFLGLSLAGYNVLISLALAALALWGARDAWRGRYGSSSVSQYK